jgi:Flp pilus assembly protein TadG
MRLRHLRDFLDDQRGSTMVFFGLAVLMLTAAVGCAVDMARAEAVRSKLSLALDAAGLAAGATIDTDDVQTEASKYFNANFNSVGMDATVVSMTAVPNSDNSVIELNATVKLPTTLMRVMGFSNLTLTAASEITRTSKGMELVLVLDNTGSMNDPAGGSQTKIQAAQQAATTLLNILYGGNATVPNLWVGLVPFSQAVNIGTGYTSWLDSTYDATLNWATTSWGGCVESRSNGTNTPQYDITDDVPSTRPFREYYWPDDSSNNWITTSTYCSGRHSSNCTTTTNYTYNSTHGPNLYCPQAVTPMVAEKATVINGVNAMTAAGNTHIDLGLAWGWRLLSPSWRNLWGGEMNTNSLPLDYNTPLMNKVVVLMTDGDNTITNGYYSAYGYPSAGQLGPNACSSYNCTTGINELNTRTAAICSSMKAKGILIYTVALGTDVSTTGQNLLKNCASKPEYYFLSPTTTDLQKDFAQIGDSLANLRVSK